MYKVIISVNLNRLESDQNRLKNYLFSRNISMQDDSIASTPNHMARTKSVMDDVTGFAVCLFRRQVQSDISA